MEKIQKFFILGIQVGLAVSPLVFAQSMPAQPLPQAPITTMSGVIGLINNIINWMFTFLIILSVLFFIWAAFDYLTSAGDKEKTEKAKNRLIYGVFAIAVAILARGIPLIVGNFLGTSINVPQN